MKKLFFCLILSWVLSNQIHAQPVSYPLIKGNYHSIAKNDSLLYCLNGYGLVIINYADSLNPRVLSHLPFPYATDILINNDQVYITHNNDSTCIQVIDVSDPNNPTITGKKFGKGFPKKIEIKNNLIYLAVNGQDFQIYDPTTATPVEVFRGLDSFIPDFMFFDDVLSYAKENIFFRYDVSDTIPIKLDSIEAPNNYSYISSISNNQIAILTLRHSNPDSIERIITYVYDVSSIGAPVFVDSIENSHYLSSNFRHYKITDSTLFTHNNEYLYNYDISNPGTINVLDSLHYQNYPANPHRIVFEDENIFVANNKNGIRLYDVDNTGVFNLRNELHLGGLLSSIYVAPLDNILATDKDSIYLFNKHNDNKLNADHNHRLITVGPNDDLFVKDSILVKYFADSSLITFSNLNHPATLDTFSSLDVSFGSNLSNYFKLFNQTIYYIRDIKTNIVDFNNPNSLVHLATGVDFFFDDGIEATNIFYEVDKLFSPARIQLTLYDGSTGLIPSNIVSHNLFTSHTNLPSFIDQIPDPDRSVIHFTINNRKYVQVDISDPFNIIESLPIELSNTTLYSSHSIAHDSLFIYTSENNTKINFLDTRNINTFNIIDSISTDYVVVDMVAAGDSLYVAYPSHIAVFDISKVKGPVPTSVSSHSKEKEIRAFPNPTMGIVTFRFQEFPVHLTLVNTLGQIVFEKELKQQNYQLNTRNLSRGIYIFKGRFEDNTIRSGKLIVH